MAEVHTAIVVEDDEEIRFLIEFILQNQGYHVTLAKDGNSALALLDNVSPPNLVVMDIMLPFMDGLSLVKHLREKPAWKEVPVLMLTAKTQEEDVLEAVRAGANDYLTKPFEPMELIKRVQRVVGSV